MIPMQQIQTWPVYDVPDEKYTIIDVREEYCGTKVFYNLTARVAVEIDFRVKRKGGS